MKALRVMVVFTYIACITACSPLQQSPINTSVVKPPALSSENDSVVNRLTAQHQQWKGVKYRYGGLSKSGVDCSGFVFLTFKEQFNINLPRSTQQLANVGTQIAKDQLKPGDLVLFKTGFKVRHIGIYAGEQKFLHASTSRGVIFSRLDNPYWKNNFWQARRVL